jgi:hypothetical protein
MHAKRRATQRALPLFEEVPATLTREEQQELVRALAELLLAVATSEHAAKVGGRDEHENQ